MEKVWIITIAATIFLLSGVLVYKSLTAFVIEKFGDKWLTHWGNRLYFWQSLCFTTLAATALILFLLKWLNILSF